MRRNIFLLIFFLSISFVHCTRTIVNKTYSLTTNVQHVLSLLGLGAASDPYDLQYLKRSIVSELSERLSPQANIITDEEAEFSIVNARYTDYKRPGYIVGVQVAEENDVVETVNYARMRGIPFQARTGGHSLTSSLRSIQQAMVIDMRGLNSISYDKAKEQMTVGGGVVTGAFANATFSQGMEVTVGSCPCTGVLGISLGAGIGRLQGKYGYLNDNLVSIRLLLANGTIITASEFQNKDIFWAVRGAGHNFGIGLEATFQVHPQQNKGMHYIIDFEFQLDKVESLFDLINEVASPMPKELAIFVIERLVANNYWQPTININIVYSGPSEEARTYVDRFQALNPVHRDEKVSAWDALPWATYNGLNNILCTPQGWARFPIKNFYAANVKTYHIPTMRKFFDGWQEMNEKYDGQAMFSVMFETFPQQGVRAKSSDATAYPWRDGSDHFLMMEVGYRDHTYADLFDEWLSNQQDMWIESSGYGRLQQYVNYGHGSKDPPESLYGYEPWRLAKLKALKAELDPEGRFNGYQPFVSDEK
ncbi:FAD/FMN-dependent oxygenase/oxidase [Mollisia scopiformis]|uniref:FAD/FMN-dependent oxygenase/oxidase n=1 Tax=Mollisia scopiformis TaxID=149040 RepID=A0A194XL80_MOLSC|nr:FAD/FMN-dependent oxygenase/oxidase [Mollisia scopiformis]KUJ20849.1 FAD/FMN-dependent oxygenase/oxidase [Mollisia scopiformis]